MPLRYIYNITQITRKKKEKNGIPSFQSLYISEKIKMNDPR